MLTRRTLSSFRKALLGWFHENQRDLPWRRTQDPYRIWLSEIMLQQTRVATVIAYYERFIERFPTIQALAEAPEEEVLQRWSGLGYYSRARNLQKAAREIVSRFGGQFPRSREAVISLAGIGEYTASAITSIAFGEPSAVLDGNVARVLARLGAMRGDLREAKRWQALQKEADRLLDPASPGDWNQAMMELGAMRCTPRAPQCSICPVATHCQGRKLGIAELLPEARKKREAVDVNLFGLVVTNAKGQTLLLPPPTKSLDKTSADHVPTLVSNLWHFPTIPANGEKSRTLDLLYLGVFSSRRPRATEFEPLPIVRHSVTYRKIALHPFHLRVPKLPKLRGARTVALQRVTELAISNLTRKVARVAIAAATSR